MKVLLATDGSSDSMTAAKFLSDLWLESDSELTMVSVSHDPAQMAMSYVPVAADWREQEQKRVNSYQTETESELKGTFKTIKKLHRIGDAATEILAVAKEISADLIVLGAVGHSMVHRIFLGSVSDRVATHADCSVVVVRPSQEQLSPREKILIAYDGSSPAREAVEEFLQLPWNPPTDVSVLSVIQEYEVMFGDGLSGAALSSDKEWVDRMTKKNQTMVDRIRELVAEPHSIVSRSHHVGDAIVECCEKNETQIVVIGDAGHSAMEDILLGSTTKFVLRHAPCTVWISRRHRSELPRQKPTQSQDLEHQAS